ncbi:hypothetical protein [Desulfosporosinus nitroreducens]|uniref:hypothetical protein n=1 Tax=Desulfosporosinus nitroreducens TaxID=2018668 RepID=UPI00207D0ED8|nr:hypothetical protein [Desulfosporosinus nitroreducens]MCO1604686.1 hypothetical protein [Desulfosporosinus nitroreducens]
MVDATQATLGVLLIPLAMSVALIIFAVWHVRKLNSINQTVRDILEKLKNDNI